jgi:hypothetical protein
MTRDSPDGLDNAITRRLHILRHYVAGSDHGSKARFAARIGIEYKRWNNFERGYPIPRDMAIHLVKAIHGLTLDWIYLGREDGLSVVLQRALTEAGKSMILSEDSPGSGSSKNPITKDRA